MWGQSTIQSGAPVVVDNIYHITAKSALQDKNKEKKEKKIIYIPKLLPPENHFTNVTVKEFC